MIFFLALCIVIILPLSIFYYNYGKKKTSQVLFFRGGFVWIILLFFWALKNQNLLLPTIDFLTLCFLIISLGLLSNLCLEDMLNRSVPVIPLYLAVFFLIGHHFFNLWHEYDILLNDYIISVCCALSIWLISKIFLILTGRPSLGSADTPLIFALSLGMTISGVTSWIILFCSMALINQIFKKMIFNKKNALLEPVPLIPYMVGATALINLTN